MIDRVLDRLTPLLPSLQYLDTTRQRRERRAQLVRGIGHEVALQPQRIAEGRHRPARGEPGDQSEQDHAEESEHDHPRQEPVRIDDEVVPRSLVGEHAAVLSAFRASIDQDHREQDRHSRRDDDRRRHGDIQADRQRRLLHAAPVILIAHEGLPAR